VLDTRLIRERRLALGLSQGALAGRLGVSPPLVRKLEQGENHHHLTLALVGQVGEVLGVPLHELVSAPDERAEANPDDLRVEAALAERRKKVRASELARALGWTLPRTHAALKRLRQRLEPTGQRLQQRLGGWRLTSRGGVLTQRELEVLERATTARLRLTRYDALVLRALVQGELDPRWEAHANEAQRVALGRLLKRGYAQKTSSGFAPTDDVVFSLALTEELGR